MKKLLLSIALFASAASLNAQTTYYYSGFDNAGQTAGWQQFRKGYLSVSQWTLPTFGAYSPPAMLHHDYPVGSAGTDTTVDWYVSPVFDFSAGGMIDSLKVRIYSITGSGTPVDYLGLVLLQGSNDPSLATQTVLANLSGMVSSANVWEDTGNFAIPPTAGLCYVGIKYRATNNWFVVDIDDVFLNGISTGVSENKYLSDIKIFPNPATDVINIEINNTVAYNTAITDAAGKTVFTKNDVSGFQSLNIAALPAGYYTLVIQTENEVSRHPFIKK